MAISLSVVVVMSCPLFFGIPQGCAVVGGPPLCPLGARADAVEVATARKSGRGRPSYRAGQYQGIPQGCAVVGGPPPGRCRGGCDGA